MFVLSFHRACKDFEFLCASIPQNVNKVSSKADPFRINTETEFHEKKIYAIFASCNFVVQDDASRFIRHCIRIRKYFHGETCKVEYMKGALCMYNENVSEL